MGTALREYLAETPGISLQATLELGEPLDGFIKASPDVVVDLSLGPAVDENGPQLVRAGLPYIVGATGYLPETLKQLRELSAERETPVLVAIGLFVATPKN